MKGERNEKRRMRERERERSGGREIEMTFTWRCQETTLYESATQTEGLER